MSLPFGVILGNDKEAEVVITDNDSKWILYKHLYIGLSTLYLHSINDQFPL